MEREEFFTLINQLSEETRLRSNPHFVRIHPIFEQLLAEGEHILPWVFEAIATQPFPASMLARRITGFADVIHPLPDEVYCGRVANIQSSWIAWARWHGYYPWDAPDGDMKDDVWNYQEAKEHKARLNAMFERYRKSA